MKKDIIRLILVVLIALPMLLSFPIPACASSPLVYENYTVNDDTSGGMYWIGANAYWEAQLFTPLITHYITSVDLKLYRIGSAETWGIGIRATAAGKPTGANLDSATYAAGSITLLTAGEWISIPLSRTLLLTAGTTYAIVGYNVTASSSTQQIRWRTDSTSAPYTVGTRCDSGDGGVTWAIDAGWDNLFREYGLLCTFPTVVTKAADSISYTSAHLNGNVTNTGGENVDQRGFDWDIDSGAPYANSWIQGGSFGTGPYDCDTQVFPICTKIYFRAKAANSAGWAYGGEGNFTTLCHAAPTVNTVGSSDITCDYANIYGNITDLGGIAADTWGFDWGTVPGVYTDGFSISLGGYGNGTYGTSIFPADSGETYYYRFYAINDGGRGNGTEMSFTTPWCPPQCPTNMTVTQTGVDSVLITWTTGLYATNTTIVVKEESPPTDQFDGWQTFFGNATSVTRTGLDLGMVEYFYLGFSSNPAGNSTCINAVSIGGASMVFMGWMAFFGIFWLGTLWAASKWPEWLIKLANSLFALGAWYYLYFGTTPPKLDYSSNTGVFISFAFLLLVMVPWIIQMNVWNRTELGRSFKGGLSKSTSYESYGPKSSQKKNYNDAYYNRRAELHDRLRGKGRRR